jgi:hypothetical protein
VFPWKLRLPFKAFQKEKEFNFHSSCLLHGQIEDLGQKSRNFPFRRRSSGRYGEKKQGRDHESL